MQIHAHTKISEIIHHNQDSIDAIASIAPPLKKLKNPLLRKMMAHRVTVAEAAKIGRCTVQDFEKALRPLGYTFVAENNTFPESDEATKTQPDWLQSAPIADIAFYDVRPVLERGTDPLKEIMQKFKSIPHDKILCIINSFVPTPLIHLLEKNSAHAWFVKKINDKEYHTFFLKKKKQEIEKKTTNEKVVMHSAGSFQKINSLFLEERKKEIDVRALEMPLPMQTILAQLAQLPPENALFVHHKRVPMYLLEELADKDYTIHIYNKEEGDIKMLIFKNEKIL